MCPPQPAYAFHSPPQLSWYSVVPLSHPPSPPQQSLQPSATLAPPQPSLIPDQPDLGSSSWTYLAHLVFLFFWLGREFMIFNDAFSSQLGGRHNWHYLYWEKTLALCYSLLVPWSKHITQIRLQFVAGKSRSAPITFSCAVDYRLIWMLTQFFWKLVSI